MANRRKKRSPQRARQAYRDDRDKKHRPAEAASLQSENGDLGIQGMRTQVKPQASNRKPSKSGAAGRAQSPVPARRRKPPEDMTFEFNEDIVANEHHPLAGLSSQRRTQERIDVIALILARLALNAVKNDGEVGE